MYIFAPATRRALASAAPPCVCRATAPLDVLAPAYARHALVECHKLVHTAADAVTTEKPLGAPRRKPLHKRTASPSTSNSPADILQKVRLTSPQAGAEEPAKAVVATAEEHNRALQNILAGPRYKRVEDRFSRAFEQGWTRIRLAGNVARPRAEDLAFVLDTTHAALKSDKNGAKWQQVKELVLWLAGEHDAPGVVAWCWKQLRFGGFDGAKRVVETWQAVSSGAHAKLRNGDQAIDFALKSNRPFIDRSDHLPGGVFAAYVAARYVLNSEEPVPQAFSEVLPSLLMSQAPFLKSFVERGLDRNLQDAFSLHDRERMKAWIMQTYCAQMWFDSRSRTPGFVIVRLARQYFRTAQPAQAWQLWTILAQAIEDEHVSWISTENWADNGNARLLTEATLEDAASPEIELESLGNAELDAARSRVRTIGTAYLSQAHVVPFLSGFTRAEMYDKATQLWSWLGERGLHPGAALWNALIFGYAARGDVDAVERVVQDMQAAGVEPDVDTWLERISARFENKQPDEAMRLAEDMERASAAAQQVNGRLPPTAYDRIILGLLANGRPEEAEGVLEHMDRVGVPPTVHTINNILRYYTRSRKPDLLAIVRCIQQISTRRLEADVYTYTMVLQSLLNAGHKDAVAKVIKMMEASGVKPTPTTYGTIIHNLASSGEPEKLQAAVKLVEEMEAKGIATNEIIYTSVMQGFLRAAAQTPGPAGRIHPYVEAAFQLKERMQDRNILINRIAYNALIGAALQLRSTGGVELAMTLFRELQQQRRLWTDNEIDRAGKVVPLAQTWLVVLSGLAEIGQWRLGRELVAEMEQSGFQAQGRALIRVVDKIQRGGSV
ncbi:hypothetical protein OIV83_005471 [Microbotryomycetes sp. JL201]|nr:hypothetical protein OIV83_005471 [Microbotryomycetes sp. JL201]